TDTFARLMAQKLTEQFGKQVYVENIAGATGNIGTALVAKAAPDGYTILFAFSSHVVNPTLFARLPYDPINDFKPVTLAVASTTVVTINPAVPAKTVEELVELIKANPGKYSFGSAGAGTQAHLAGEQFRLSFGLDLVHLPFRRGGPPGAGGGRAGGGGGGGGTRKQAPARRRLPCSTSRKEPCGRSRSPARRARKSFPTCRP